MPTFSLSKFLLGLIALCLLPCLFMGRAGAQATYNPGAPTIASVPGLQSALNNKGPIYANTNGIYEPLFLSASGLASTSGTFAVASGGGLVASTAGVAASGIINLPQAIDYTKPWRFACLVDYEGDNANYPTIKLQNPNDTSYGEIDWVVYLNTIIVNAGGTSLVNETAGVAAGQKYWFFAASDGTTVSAGWMPFANAGLSLSPAYHASSGVSDTFTTFVAATANNGGHTPIFTNLSQIKLTNASTSTKILGVFFTQGLTGGLDSRMQPPAIVQATVAGDSNVFIRIPKSYTGKTPTDIIFLAHPNGSDENVAARPNDPDSGAAIASLVNAGYIVVTQRGDSANSYTSATASSWGSANGLRLRKATIDYVRSVCPNTRNVYWIGQSMGLLDGLNFAMTYPGVLKAVAGISGVANLSAAYNGANGGASLASYVNIAYPTYYVSLAAGNVGAAVSNTTSWKQVSGPGGILNTALYPGTVQGAYAGGATYGAGDIVTSNATALSQVTDHDPTLRPGALIGTPIKLWHGDSDPTIPLAQTSAFISAMSGVGSTVPLVTVAGAAHLNAAALWDGPGLLAFFQANQ